jgi:hypothetical protein
VSIVSHDTKCEKSKITCRQFGNGSVEKLVSAIEGLEKLGLLLVDDVLD